jgi:hypothetical protein
MRHPLDRADHYRNEAVKCHELAKHVQPAFLGDFYRRIAVRYMFMAEDRLNEARARGMNEALAEAAKTMASAISSGLPTRFSGTPATISTASTIYRTVAQALPAGRPAMARCSHGIRLEELEQERDDVVGRNAGDDHRRDLRQNLQDSAHSGA